MGKHRISDKYKNTTHYVLSSLIPYTESNLKLVFTPKQFFQDLSKIDNRDQKSIKNAYYNCIQNGYVTIDEITNTPIITDRGKSKIQLLSPSYLEDSSIMVIFDIPEEDRWKRRQFRALLNQLKFTQVQKSVWMSEYDSRDYLREKITRLAISDFVKVFEAVEVKI